MKHTVHVTVTYSMEIDDSTIKQEYSLPASKKRILEHTKNNFDVRNMCECSVKIIESYDDTKQVKKGIGSY
jgi:hypothetical protein